MEDKNKKEIILKAYDEFYETGKIKQKCIKCGGAISIKDYDCYTDMFCKCGYMNNSIKGI